MIRIILVNLMALVFSLNLAFADSLYLENGNIVRGQLVKEDASQVIFMVGGEGGIEVTFFKDEIIRIDKEDQSNTLNMTLGEDKQVSLPMPDLSKMKPIITQKVGSQLESQSKMKSDSDISGAMAGTQEMNDELMPLLSKEELEYFMKFTDITKESATRISTDVMNLNNAGVDAPKEGQVIGLIDNSSSELGNVMAELEQLIPPLAFENFHSKYLANLGLLSGIFSSMKDGQDMQAVQEQVNQVQQNNQELKAEFQKILDLKKATKAE